ncbi:feruloyl esterase b precursor [Colletotrichum karsti]|uniref:Carboxylic ester hydrolase n=1 Tax=Colletotrichum karsti TaxID=1095194 RepID=A0A9P6I068_9PEZI|nr:feruloyl esterase b precursor [Colletotrichum karsti]KAF9873395.1 feruloyl esterase b precursor [Colletotrichum karsti]
MAARLPLALSMLGATMAVNAQNSSACNAAAFAALTLSNIEIISLDVAALRNQSLSTGMDAGTGVGVGIISAPTGETASGVDLCRISIQYTHPGQGDNVNTYIGLPLDAANWNSRFMMSGGGGWTAGGAGVIISPVASGYSTSSTDGGHNTTAATADWGLVSEGNVNWPALNDFASVALDEAAKLGKAATQLYYGKDPTYSYWNGCSTGGRQGHMMAQRFPEHFDGILASASAFNWQKFQTASLYPAFLAEHLDVVPPACVLNAFTNAAIEACDELDGVQDKIISLPGSCKFNATSLVGQTVACTNPNATVTISEKMAEFVHGFWEGPRSGDGNFFWYGFNQDAPLTGVFNPTCTTVDNCTYAPFSATDDWFGVFLEKNSTWSISTSGITQERFDQLHRISVDEYTSSIGTDNVDLTNFKKRGTKMLTWHGMQDPLIPYNGTVDYYDRVKAWDPNVEDYYRFFPAPGVSHCGGGSGFDPSDYVFDALRAWVENGTAPETLTGEGAAVGNSSESRKVNLCMYPKILTFVGTDPDDAASYDCI